MAKTFAAVLTAYPAALADLGAVFAACPAVSADVSRANTAQAVTAVVLFVAVASAFCRAVVAAFSAVADVIVRDEAAAELAGALHIPCMRREHQALVVVIESDRDQNVASVKRALTRRVRFENRYFMGCSFLFAKCSPQILRGETMFLTLRGQSACTVEGRMVILPSTAASTTSCSRKYSIRIS